MREPRLAGCALALAGMVLVLATPVSAGATPVVAAQDLQRDLRVAREALDDGRVDAAIAELRRLAAAHPHSDSVALWLGNAQRLNGDLPAATREYLRGLQLRPTNPDILIALGELQESAGLLPEAAAYYERAIEVAPDQATAYRKAANVEVQLENPGGAIAHLQRYLELQGDHVEAMAVLGTQQYLHQEHDAGIKTLERVLALDPGNSAAHHTIGAIYAERPDQHDKALEHLRTAVETDESNANAHYLFGTVLADRGEVQEAIRELERSLELDPDLADRRARLAQSAHYRLAILHQRAGNDAASRQHQQRFSELAQQRQDAEARGKELRTLKNAVAAAIEDQDLARAVEAARQLAAAYSDDASSLALAAWVWLATDQRDQALAAVERAIELEPDHWEALYVRGVLLLRAGRPGEARDSLERSLRRNPLLEQTHAMLGNVLMALDDPEGAIDAYLAAASLNPDNPATYLNLATAYGRLGMSELEAEALANHRRLLRED